MVRDIMFTFRSACIFSSHDSRPVSGHVSPSDITATELYTESLLIRTPSRTFLALKGSVAFILFSRVNPVARQTLVSWSSSLKTDGVSSSAGNKNRRFITTENKPTEHPNVSRVKASPHDVTPKGLDSVQPLKRIHLSPVLNRSKSSSNLVEVHSGYDQVKATQNQYSAHQANQSPPKPVKVCSSFKTTPRLLTKAPRVMASFRIDLKTVLAHFILVTIFKCSYCYSSKTPHWEIHCSS